MLKRIEKLVSRVTLITSLFPRSWEALTGYRNEQYEKDTDKSLRLLRDVIYAFTSSRKKWHPNSYLKLPHNQQDQTRRQLLMSRLPAAQWPWTTWKMNFQKVLLSSHSCVLHALCLFKRNDVQCHCVSKYFTKHLFSLNYFSSNLTVLTMVSHFKLVISKILKTCYTK